MNNTPKQHGRLALKAGRKKHHITKPYPKFPQLPPPSLTTSTLHNHQTLMESNTHHTKSLIGP